MVSQGHMVRRARELALRADLACLRAGIEFFSSRHHRLPAGLEEVLAEPIGSAKLQGRWSLPRNRQGALADAFGHPYRYHSDTGTVTSAAPGYERW